MLLSFSISILLINFHWWFFESRSCCQCIIFANIFSCLGLDYSHIHELLHIWHHFKQSLFIFEWSRNLLKYSFSMFIIFFSDCSVCLGIAHVFELVLFVLHCSESAITHLSESAEQLTKHCLTVWIVCLGLIQVWRPLVSIAFNYKWFEELSFCSVSMFCSINNICDSITNNFVSNIQLFVWIQFSHLQEISSFNSIFCIQWLYVASEQRSRVSIRWNSFLVSRIWIQCCFFIVKNSHRFFYSGKLKFLYLSSNAVKLKYISSDVIDDVQLQDLLQNVICSSQSLYDESQTPYSAFIESGSSAHHNIISRSFKSSGIVWNQAVYSTSSIHQSFNGNFLNTARLSYSIK